MHFIARMWKLTVTTARNSFTIRQLIKSEIVEDEDLLGVECRRKKASKLTAVTYEEVVV